MHFLEFKIKVTDLHLLIRKWIEKKQMKRLEKVTLKELIWSDFIKYSKHETIFEKWIKEWESFIISPNARSGKNTTYYKTHKPNIPVRFLTT